MIKKAKRGGGKYEDESMVGLCKVKKKSSMCVCVGGGVEVMYLQCWIQMPGVPRLQFDCAF